MEDAPVTIETMVKNEPKTTPASGVVDQKVVAELVARASAEGVSLTGEGGLLQQLTKLVLESSLEGEMDAHLGYGKHDPAGRTGGNSRNGRRSKTVVTEVGPIDVEVPRDRDGSFEPQIVRKRQRRLDGVDGIVLSLSAKGLTTGEISAHLAEVYGASVSKDTISAITDRVLDAMAQWQSRPLDPVYPVVFVDAIRVKIRDGNVLPARRSRPPRARRLGHALNQMAAMTTLRIYGPNRDYYQRKRDEGRNHQQAIIALSRRRVDVLWALLRDNRLFQPEPPPRRV
jgi:hypothetical protein